MKGRTQLRFGGVHCVGLELKEERAATGGRIQEATIHMR
jgi:hypothetical protein